MNLFCKILFIEKLISLFVLLNLLNFNYILKAQNALKWQNNYDLLLHQFETEFIALGEGKGTGLPAILIDSTVVWNKRTQEKGFIKFGDVPVYQGFYMAVLASDLLLSPKKNNDILNKMYFVLKSKNRLDISAEIRLNNAKSRNSNKANGFFIRDDIDEATGRKLFKQPYINSDLISLKDPAKNAMSQDQVFGWMMGYTFTLKALENNKTEKGREIYKMAEEQLTRLLSFLRKNKWVIRNPIDKKMVKRGPNAKLQSYPIVETGKLFLGLDFSSPISEGLGKLTWKITERGFKYGRSVTIADRFANKKRYLIYGDINNSMILKLAAMSNTWQPIRLAKACELGDLEIYELMNAFLFDRKPLIDRKKIEKMLNGMTSKGAYFFSEKSKAPNGWASRDRWSHPGEIYTGNSRFKGKYPSLDFLLLYNLYLLTYRNE